MSEIVEVVYSLASWKLFLVILLDAAYAVTFSYYLRLGLAA